MYPTFSTIVLNIEYNFMKTYFICLFHVLNAFNPFRSLDCYALMKPSFRYQFSASRLQWNLFVKAEEQGYVYIVIALARKGRMKFNPIAPSNKYWKF